MADIEKNEEWLDLLEPDYLKRFRETDWTEEDTPPEKATTELERLVPSRYVRAYIEKTGWQFTDFQKAALLENSSLPLEEKHTCLRELGERTDDETLRGQITEYLADVERELAAFRQNDRREYIYTLEVSEPNPLDSDEMPKIYRPQGYFFDWELACAYGKEKGFPFSVEKHLVVEKPNLKRTRSGYFNPYLFTDLPEEKLIEVEESEYDGYAVAHLCFSADGEALYYWSDEIEPSDRMAELKKLFDPRYFPHLFFAPPNPFEKGDVVRFIGKAYSYGIVETSQEDWRDFLEQQKSGLYCDFFDASIVVEFLTKEGDFTHEHINPVNLGQWT